jgi:hypothetical protein
MYGTIQTREFQHIMEEYYGDSLGFFFDEWVWGQNRPVYRYSWTKRSAGDGQYDIFLHVRQTQSSPAPNIFTMPIRIYPRIDGVDTVLTIWNDSREGDFHLVVNGNPTTLTFDRDYWILRDAASEVYRVNIITFSLPNGRQDSSYSEIIEAIGGTPPYTFSVVSGLLPDGLTLNSSTGVLAGTPTTPGQSSFTIRCTDSSGPAQTDDQGFSIEIAGFSGCDYFPGDINGVPQANGIDVTYGVAYLKGGSPPPVRCDNCPLSAPFYAAMDVNGTCSVNGIDITYFVSYLKGGPALMYCPDCPPANR